MATIISDKHGEDPELQRKVKQVGNLLEAVFVACVIRVKLNRFFFAINTICFAFFEGDGCDRARRGRGYCGAA